MSGNKELDASFRSGLELIQDAFNRKSNCFTNDINQLKQQNTNQRQQITSLEHENKTLIQRVAELERIVSNQTGEMKALNASKVALQERHAHLKKSAMQLESFRKNIVSMVEYGPAVPVHMLEMEHSFAEPVEGDGLRKFSNSVGHGNQTMGGSIRFDHSAGSDGTERRIPSHTSDAATLQSPSVNGVHKNDFTQSNTLYDDQALRSFELSSQSLDYSLGIHPSEKAFFAKGQSPFSMQNRGGSRQETNPYRSSEGEKNNYLDQGHSLTEDSLQSVDDGNFLDGKRMGRSIAALDFLPSTSPTVIRIPQQQNGNIKSPVKKLDPVIPTNIIDAPTLYKQIRDTLSPIEFEDFAANVAAFNASEQSADETVRNIGRLVKDKILFAQMRTLIYTALAESARNTQS